MKRGTLCPILLLLWANQGLAEVPRPDAQREARQHFQEGLTKAAQGDLTAALAEFETAYATRPHFSVLYNIGQARAALGKPAEAVEAFERYLAEGGKQLRPERTEEIRALIETNRKRFGLLRVTTTTPNTQIWLDGRKLAESEVDRPLTLLVGKHSLVYSGPDGPPKETSVVVLAGQTVEANLSAPQGQPASPGQLSIVCPVPGVQVEVAGTPRGATPLAAPLLVPAGTTSVRFSRAGYAPVAHDFVVAAERATTVSCDQHPVDPISPLLAARLELRTTPINALVLVDGEPFHGGSLVSGLHNVRIESDGYLPRERGLLVAPGRTSLLDERLVPTAAAIARERETSKRRDRMAFMLGGAGVAFLGTGAAVYAWNNGRYADWGSQRSSRTQNQNLARVTSIQRADDAAVGVLVAGAGLVLGSAWLFFTD